MINIVFLLMDFSSLFLDDLVLDVSVHLLDVQFSSDILFRIQQFLDFLDFQEIVLHFFFLLHLFLMLLQGVVFRVNSLFIQVFDFLVESINLDQEIFSF